MLGKKAASGDKTYEEYLDYYTVGYKTDLHTITIHDGEVKFISNDETLTVHYVNDGYETLTYEKGNRGVLYVFKKESGDNNAPMYIQFSDHIIAPKKSDHYHLYWGDDRTALFSDSELTNWPTYYPNSLSEDDVVKEMLAH